MQKGVFLIRQTPIHNSAWYSKVVFLHGTFSIFWACGTHGRRNLIFMAVGRCIFLERVVIFGDLSDSALTGRWALRVQPGDAKSSGRLLHAIFVRVLTF